MSANQEESSHQILMPPDLNLKLLRSRIVEKINSHHLSHLICGILLWQPKQHHNFPQQDLWSRRYKLEVRSHRQNATHNYIRNHQLHRFSLQQKDAEFGGKTMQRCIIKRVCPPSTLQPGVDTIIFLDIFLKVKD